MNIKIETTFRYIIAACGEMDTQHQPSLFIVGDCDNTHSSQLVEG